MKIISSLLLLIAFLLSFAGCNKSEINLDKIVENRPASVTTKQTHVVSFQTNGGTKIDPVETDSLSVAPITTKEGYDFKGWYLDSDLTKQVIFPMNIVEDVVVYAKWEKNGYKVIFNSNGGTTVNNVLTDVLQFSPETQKNGHAFQGWYRDSGLTQKATFPMYLSEDIVLYAKWLKTTDEVKLDSLQIAKAKGYSESKTIDITPKGLDLENLASQGYYVTITVSYDVKYQKNYDILWDIGYMGAPEYEFYLYMNSGVVSSEKKIKTPSSSTRKSVTWTEKAVSMKGSKVSFKVSTDNIQNIVVFDNITVTYQCTK